MTPLCLSFNCFPLFYRIKNSCSLHELLSASVCPSHFTSCSLLSAHQRCVKHHAPSGHRPFAHTFPLICVFLNFLYSQNSQPSLKFSDHPLWSRSVSCDMFLQHQVLLLLSNFTVCKYTLSYVDVSLKSVSSFKLYEVRDRI